MTTDAASRPRSFLRISDLDAGELAGLLDLAAAMKDRPTAWHATLTGETVACWFTNPATRARSSMETAIARLGGVPILLGPDELRLDHGAPIADTARVLSSYAAAIVMRTVAQRDVEEVARHAAVPVVNASTDEHHPCQALADLLTVRERFGTLDGLTVAYVGDGNEVAHSLIEACALAGVEIAVATPGELEPNPSVVEWAWERGLQRSSSRKVIRIHDDPVAAVRGAHAVYTDGWDAPGDDARRQRRLRLLEPFRVDERLMAAARDDAVFLHCLPARRGEEVVASVIDGPQSVVWQQAANRLPVEQAVLHALVSGEL